MLLTIDELLDSLEPGEIFTVKDLIDRSGITSVSEVTIFFEDFINYVNGNGLLYGSDKKLAKLSPSVYQKIITRKDQFVQDAAKAAKGKKALRELIDIWIDHAPYKTWFTHWTVSGCFPNKIDIDKCTKYLEQAVATGILKSKQIEGKTYYQKTLLLSNIDPQYNEIQRLFVKFLIENDALEEYENIIKKEKDGIDLKTFLTGQYGYWEGVAKLTLPIGWINDAFDVNKQEKPFNYWNMLHRNWLKCIILHYKPDYEAVLKDIHTSLDTIANKVFKEMAQELLCLNGWYNNDPDGKPKWSVLNSNS